jgi:PKHD-type hydroxylase
MKPSELDTIYDLYDIFWEDLLSDEEIQKVHQLAELFKNETGGRGTIKNNTISDSRKSNVIWIKNTSESHWLYKKVSDAVRKINDETYQFELNGAEPFQYTIYEASELGEYSWHKDSSYIDENNIRKISVSVLLSDTRDFKGGSFLFSPDGIPKEIEQEKGRMIVFPSWIPHCVNPVLKGTRISLVMWLYGKKFK